MEFIVGWSALLAAAATVVGAVLLGLFFARGQPWGTLNDVSSIVLMAASIPVAIGVALAEVGDAGIAAWGAAGVGIVGMVGAGSAQGLLVAGVRSYGQLLPATLGFGAVVGVWYLLIGALGLAAGMSTVLVGLAVASGVGYVALGYGFWRGNERHPVSVAGGLVLLVASTAFLVGFALVAFGGD